MGIIRRAKFPQQSPLTRYRDARTAICAYLTDPVRSVNPLAVAEAALRQRATDTSVGSLTRDDARLSLDVIAAIQGMNNQLRSFDFQPAPAEQPKLRIAGVEVSVRADMLVHGSTRTQEQIGAAVLRMTLDNAETDAAKAQRREVGTYVATLARFHTDQHLARNRQPANRLCMSIDVQHGEVFVAPNANTRRMTDIENVCRMIAAIWPSLEQ